MLAGLIGSSSAALSQQIRLRAYALSPEPQTHAARPWSSHKLVLRSGGGCTVTRIWRYGCSLCLTV